MKQGRPFTFFELLVVALIMALVAAVALPQISRMPRRMEMENALTGIRNAFTETSMRARATGTALSLALDEENSQFTVAEIQDEFAVIRGWQPSAKTPQEYENTVSVAISSKEDYDVSSAIEWLPEETGLDSAEDIVYSFFEDGQASGPSVRFKLAGRSFELNVDKLSGDSLIQELQ